MLGCITWNQVRMFGSTCLQEGEVATDALTATEMSGWNISLLHYQGVAAPFSEPVQQRNLARVSWLAQGTNVVYTHGESFILPSR